jgi:hypothetical protein
LVLLVLMQSCPSLTSCCHTLINLTPRTGGYGSPSSSVGSEVTVRVQLTIYGLHRGGVRSSITTGGGVSGVDWT